MYDVMCAWYDICPARLGVCVFLCVQKPTVWGGLYVFYLSERTICLLIVAVWASSQHT